MTCWAGIQSGPGMCSVCSAFAKFGRTADIAKATTTVPNLIIIFPALLTVAWFKRDHRAKNRKGPHHSGMGFVTNAAARNIGRTLHCLSYPEGKTISQKDDQSE